MMHQIYGWISENENQSLVGALQMYGDRPHTSLSADARAFDLPPKTHNLASRKVVEHLISLRVESLQRIRQVIAGYGDPFDQRKSHMIVK